MAVSPYPVSEAKQHSNNLPKFEDLKKHVCDPKYAATIKQSLWEAATTVTAYAVVFSLMARASNAGYPLPVLMLISMLLGAICVRSFIIMHDCGHGSFFKDKKWNTVFGFFFSSFCITPTDWKVTHAMHHNLVGNVDQDDYEWCETVWHTKADYLAMPEWKRTFWKIARQPLLFFTLAPLLVWWIEYRIPDWVMFPDPHRQFYRTSNKAMNTVVMLSRYFWIVKYVGGYQLLGLTMMAEWFGALMGILLFHAQHVYEGGYVVLDNKEWDRIAASIQGSSYLHLHPALKWFTMGIEYHHIHHLFILVPGYKLQQCHEEAPPSLFPPGMVMELTFKDWWRSLHLQAYDEVKGDFVTFAEIDADEAAKAKTE